MLRRTTIAAALAAAALTLSACAGTTTKSATAPSATAEPITIGEVDGSVTKVAGTTTRMDLPAGAAVEGYDRAQLEAAWKVAADYVEASHRTPGLVQTTGDITKLPWDVLQPYCTTDTWAEIEKLIAAVPAEDAAWDANPDAETPNRDNLVAVAHFRYRDTVTEKDPARAYGVRYDDRYFGDLKFTRVAVLPPTEDGLLPFEVDFADHHSIQIATDLKPEGALIANRSDVKMTLWMAQENGTWRVSGLRGDWKSASYLDAMVELGLYTAEDKAKAEEPESGS